MLPLDPESPASSCHSIGNWFAEKGIHFHLRHSSTINESSETTKAVENTARISADGQSFVHLGNDTRDGKVLDMQEAPSQVRRSRSALQEMLGPWRGVPRLPETSHLGERRGSQRTHEESNLW